ncbi:MAG TPA: hypothetical protein VFA34_10460 [Actinomycetota bacterium]|jgi:hypothetical protein|nr:hypothetical protein [Actinomycetota bacterium]
MRKLSLALVVVSAVVLGAAASGQARARTATAVVLISIPGISWSDIRGQELPNIRALLVSTAALSDRTASREPDLTRGYLTLGAGNPSFVPRDDIRANLAFERDDAFEGGTAAEAHLRRIGTPTAGQIVQVETPALQGFQNRRFYGAEIGRLGQSLNDAGIRTAVVSAADTALDPTEVQQRRGAVLAMMNQDGAVSYGRLNGLLRFKAQAPFGVETDPRAFVAAAGEAMRSARVTLLDMGETSRADEYVQFAATDQIDDIRRAALKRTDVIIGELRRFLRPEEGDVTVLTFSPTGPTRPPFREHLGVIGASGAGVDPSWLTSPTTGRQGMAVLSDVAPTVLDALNVAKPDSMNGTPIRQGDRRDGSSTWLSDLIELDYASSVRETFAAGAFWVVSILLSLLAILAFVVFLGPRGRWLRLLVAVAYFGLAVFPAAHIIRAFEFWWLGVIGAHVALYLVAAALAAAAWFLPGPRWAGGVALLMLSALLYGSDVAVGGPLQLNGVFGHSPLVAGRFYGVSNPGYAILFAATLLGLTELAELRGHRTLPAWGVVCCIALLPLIGLPSTGADFGGLLAGVPAVGVTIALALGWRIRWRTVILFGAAAAALAVGLSFIDRLRPPEARTHLGRFADLLVSGNLGEVGTTIERKGAASLHSLTVTRWTYFIPLGLAVLTLLLLRPRGVLRDVLPGRPLLRAGLWGTLVAGGLGFAVNDSGISIPALALAFTIPYLVLLAVDTVEPRKPKPP